MPSLLTAAIVLSCAGRSPSPQAPARPVASTPRPPPPPIDPRCRGVEPLDDSHGPLGCSDRLALVDPIVVGPGRIRLLLDVAPPGVAIDPNTDVDGAFYVLDVTPGGQQLVGTARCPELGEVWSATVAADGATHVVCGRCEHPQADCAGYLLWHLRMPLGGGAAVVRPSPIRIERDVVHDSVLLAVDVAGSPLILYRVWDYEGQIPERGVSRARAWRPNARPFDVVVRSRDGVRPVMAPAAALVRAGRLFVVERGPPEERRAVLLRIDEDGSRSVRLPLREASDSCEEAVGAPDSSSDGESLWVRLRLADAEHPGDEAGGPSLRGAVAVLAGARSVAGPTAKPNDLRLCPSGMEDGLDLSRPAAQPVHVVSSGIDREVDLPHARASCDSTGCVVAYTRETRSAFIVARLPAHPAPLR